MARVPSPRGNPGRPQRGGFALGLVVGLLIGLALALGVALWVTKVPVPFVNKVPQRTAEQDAAEAEKNRNWDPNAPLANKQVPRLPAPAASAASGVAPAAPGAARDPAAILAGRPVSPAASAPAGAAVSPGPAPAASAAIGPDPFTYFVQAGAYVSSAEAEQQRARLAMMGLNAKITEREQSGRTMYRVRVGPFEKRDLADGAKAQLDGAGIESVLVRVQRSP